MTEIGRMYEEEKEQAIKNNEIELTRQLIADGYYSDEKLYVMMPHLTIGDIRAIRAALGPAGMNHTREPVMEGNGSMTVREFLLANTNDYGPTLYIQFVVQGSNGHVLWDGNAGSGDCPEDIKVMLVASWRIMQDQQDVDTILVWIKTR